MNRKLSVWWPKLCIGALFLVFPAEALAQPAPSEPATNAQAEAPSPKMEEAKERFTRGLKLYQDGNYEAARVEFERAYALAPTWKLLYNAGYCYRQLNDYVAAIRALDRFLAEGGQEIAVERRDEVKTTLEDLRTRIASIEVTTNVAGATITIDDVPVGVSPLKEPIVVNPGRRKVSASEKGGPQATQIVTLAGRETGRVHLEITGPRTIVVEKKGASPVPYIAWGVTAALAVGTVVTGVLALDAQSEQEDLSKKLGQTPQGQHQALDDARSKTVTLSTVSDVLLGATVVGAGVAAYFTIKAIGSDSKKEQGGEVRAGIGGNGLLVSGRF